MEQKGSMLLKVISIIMMVGGIIGAVGSVIMALAAGVFSAFTSDASVQQAASDAGVNATAIGAMLWVAVAILIITAVIEIIAGVKGKNNWNNPAAATTLIVFGVVCAVLGVVGSILFATNGGSAVVSIITSVVLPVLYIIGAVQLKNQA